MSFQSPWQSRTMPRLDGAARCSDAHSTGSVGGWAGATGWRRVDAMRCSRTDGDDLARRRAFIARRCARRRSSSPERPATPPRRDGAAAQRPTSSPPRRQPASLEMSDSAHRPGLRTSIEGCTFAIGDLGIRRHLLDVVRQLLPARRRLLEARRSFFRSLRVRVGRLSLELPIAVWRRRSIDDGGPGRRSDTQLCGGCV